MIVSWSFLLEVRATFLASVACSVLMTPSAINWLMKSRPLAMTRPIQWFEAEEGFTWHARTFSRLIGAGTSHWSTSLAGTARPACLMPSTSSSRPRTAEIARKPSRPTKGMNASETVEVGQAITQTTHLVQPFRVADHFPLPDPLALKLEANAP